MNDKRVKPLITVSADTHLLSATVAPCGTYASNHEAEHV